MKQRVITVVLVLLIPVSVAAEELRVLMSFKLDIHRIEKVFIVENTRPAAVLRQQLRPRLVDKSPRSGVLARWLDSTGNILTEETIADPRITHAPTQSGPIPDKFLKPEGVYLLNAPSGSKQLWLGLPSVNLSTKQLPASELVFNLTPG